MYLHGSKKTIVRRPFAKTGQPWEGIDPLLQQIFLARGIKSLAELDRTFDKLPSPWLLSGMDEIVSYLIPAIKNQEKIIVVADFDADGATSCAVAVKGLKMLGANNVGYVVPNRFEYGYGLTPEIVELVKKQQPHLIITVDNGISSIDGVNAARAADIKVLITDHHLPGRELPAAEAIVNPNLPGDLFPSKALAGVGVMFYVLLGLRVRLREQDWFNQQGIAEPNLAQLLDYVALGTVADVAALDSINRILVYQGLQRIRSGRAHHGITAMVEISGRNPLKLSASDLGFALGPRLNAAGRLDDMSLGIRCLLSDEPVEAKALAQQLDDLNADRKEIEQQMKQEALALLKEMKNIDDRFMPAGVCLYDQNWHQGVIGILASRIKDKLHRPVIAFAPAGDDVIKGSARSIPDVHIRDVLSDIATQHPNLLAKFGGHAMAAGLTLHLHDYPAFAMIFDDLVRQRLDKADLEMKIWSDGELTEQQITVDFAESIKNAATWGHDFPEPLFHGQFEVIQARIVGSQHLKLVLRMLGDKRSILLDAIAFFVDNVEQWLGIRRCQVAYKLDINEFRGQRNLQLMIEYLEKIA
jgi:single-stranded-DNA-specific exonuclease